MHVFLSYPKSGRTWVRFMVNSYLCHVYSLDLPNVFAVEKKLGENNSIVWTHLTGAMIMQRRYYEMGPVDIRKVHQVPWLLLVRNFYATLASAYYQARDRIKVFSGSPSQFLRSSRYGAIKLVSFFNMWEDLKPQLARTHLFAYESLAHDPRGTLSQILLALDLQPDDNLLDRVVALASFENMKELSLSPAYAGTPLAPLDPKDPNTFKVRQGAGDARGYKSLFSEEDIRYIDNVVDTLLVNKQAPYYQACKGVPGTTKPVDSLELNGDRAPVVIAAGAHSPDS